MHRIVFGLILVVLSAVAVAQIKPSTRVLRQISDPTSVIEDRGSQLEVIKTLRATPQLASSGAQIVHKVSLASVSAPIGPQNLGVVFNHAMQVQGYITGEVAFKMKGTALAKGRFESALYPGLARLTGPNVYVVRARTPAEFVAVTKRLQGRNDVEWVEPIVVYGRLDGAPQAQAQ